MKARVEILKTIKFLDTETNIVMSFPFADAEKIENFSDAEKIKYTLKARKTFERLLKTIGQH